MPTLNWKEISFLVETIRPEIEGCFVERLIIPEREKLPSGYFKGEWGMRLTSKKSEGFILFSVQPRKPYLAWNHGKGPKACASASHSAFDLTLSKNLKGSRLMSIEALKEERIITLWFSQPGENKIQQYGLILSLIPATPEAFLVEGDPTTPQEGWRILARSRTIRDEQKRQEFYLPPQGGKAPQNIEIRTQFFEKPNSFYSEIEKQITSECYSLRLQGLQKELKQHMKQAQERIAQSRTSLREATREPDWQKFGDLLKSSLGVPQPLQPDSTRAILDYETGETVKVPCDPKLSLKEQVAKFYQNQKRKLRRLQEAELRLERFNETLEKLQSAFNTLTVEENWENLTSAEQLLQLPSTPPTALSEKEKKARKGLFWSGKSFTSCDGMTIHVGRNKDENLELTFKIARGNDLWLHVRGRPGAHAVIPIQAGKSASLETLLDAAHLVIHYSGGENWGKAEVDYTFKKYVKRIKNSTEASYHHNKTLIIQIDQSRIKRLLDQHAKSL